MLIVKKFGGSSVANAERIFNVADRCIEDYKKGNKIVVVLSAMGDTTDDLLELAASINPDAPKRELDMLLATGEQTSVALMAMAMAKRGVPAISLIPILAATERMSAIRRRFPAGAGISPKRSFSSSLTSS